MNTTITDTSPVTPHPPQRQDLPRDAFRFCPGCGQDALNSDNDRVIQCRNCHFKYYFNTATASGAFVFHEGQLILCIRGRDPGKGKLDVPGGFIEYDETLEQGLQREIREELNLETEDYQYLASAPNDYRYAGISYKVTDVFFTCVAPSLDALMAADDVADYRLLKPEDVVPDEFAFTSTRFAFEQLMIALSRRS